MKSTHRRNEDLMKQAVMEAQTSIERVKVSLGCTCALYVSNGRDTVYSSGVCLSGLLHWCS